MMHSMYAIANIGNGNELIKLYVEELNDINSDGTINRAYQLQNISKQQLNDRVQGNKSLAPSASTADTYTVSQLFNLVKAFDKNFHPKETSAVVNEDGTPKVVYHSTSADFTVFKKEEREGLSGKGIYFSPYSQKLYGENSMAVYLKILNPMTRENEPDGTRERNSSGIKMNIIPDFFEKYPEFDGIILRDEIVVKSPEQIKSATDNIGTYDKGNNDIRFSLKKSGNNNSELSIKKSKNDLQSDENYDRMSLSNKSSESEVQRNGYEQESQGRELGRNNNTGKAKRHSGVGTLGQTQQKEQNTPHTKRVHRSGVSAEVVTSSGLTAEQNNIRVLNELDGLNTEFYAKAKQDGKSKSKTFYTEHTMYSPDSDFERTGISIKNGTAAFTEKRLNSLMNEYNGSDSSKLNKNGYATYISPDEFLSLTATNSDVIEYQTKTSDKYGGGKLDIDTLSGDTQTPYLQIDLKNGKVTGHEGRHRMVMLRNAGILKRCKP